MKKYKMELTFFSEEELGALDTMAIIRGNCKGILMPEVTQFGGRKATKKQLGQVEDYVSYFGKGGKRKEYGVSYECDHCGTEIINRTWDMTEGEDIVVPLWTLSQTEFSCPKCGASYGTGDMDVMEFNEPDEGWDDEEDDCHAG